MSFLTCDVKVHDNRQSDDKGLEASFGMLMIFF